MSGVRRPPLRLDPDVSFRIYVRDIPDEDVKKLENKFTAWMNQLWGCSWLRYSKSRYQTGFRYILALCELRDWNVDDFVEVNLRWWRSQTRYRPVPEQLSGEKAERRYEAKLRELGYEEIKDEIVIAQFEKRRQEIENRSEGVRKARKRQREQEDLEKAAERYALEETWFQENLKNVELHTPSFIKLTPAQEHQRRKDVVFAKAKDDYLRRWRQRRTEDFEKDLTGEIRP